MAGEVIDPEEETIIIVLLNGHVVSIKLNSKYLCLQISVAQSFGQKSFREAVGSGYCNDVSTNALIKQWKLIPLLHGLQQGKLEFLRARCENVTFRETS